MAIAHTAELLAENARLRDALREATDLEASAVRLSMSTGWSYPQALAMLRSVPPESRLASPAVQVDAREVAASALLDAAASIEPLSGAPLGSGASRAEIAAYLRARAATLAGRTPAVQMDSFIQYMEARTDIELVHVIESAESELRQRVLRAAALRSPVGDGQ